MDRWHKIALALLGAAAVALGAFSLGYVLGDDDDAFRVFGSTGDSSGADVVGDAFERIRSTAVDPPSDEELARGAIRGMVKALRKSDDPYALFYSPKGYKAFQDYTTGKFSGIGVWLKEKRGRLEIVSVLPSTPALEAGLEQGDVIRAVDGRGVAGASVESVVGRIKGPEGTEVGLTVARDGKTMQFRITRASIDLPNLVASKPAPDLGYVRLFGFAQGTAAELRQRVERFVDNGIDGMILDLRDNGGGLFSEAIDVASVFLERGEVVSFKERSKPEIVYEAEGDAFENLPIVVLVNEGTASASEIVAGALQDRDRAIVVGAKTFGKGSVQEVFPLGDSSALKFTTGAYMTPSGRDIDGEGIEPDVEVVADPSVQKQRAIEILRGVVISTTGPPG